VHDVNALFALFSNLNQESFKMPKTAGGIIGWLVSTVIVVFVGLWILNKTGLSKYVSGGA
jgi:hypothetical protein